VTAISIVLTTVNSQMKVVSMSKQIKINADDVLGIALREERIFLLWTNYRSLMVQIFHINGDVLSDPLEISSRMGLIDRIYYAESGTNVSIIWCLDHVFVTGNCYFSRIVINSDGNISSTPAVNIGNNKSSYVDMRAIDNKVALLWAEIDDRSRASHLKLGISLGGPIPTKITDVITLDTTVPYCSLSVPTGDIINVFCSDKDKGLVMFAFNLNLTLLGTSVNKDFSEGDTIADSIERFGGTVVFSDDRYHGITYYSLICNDLSCYSPVRSIGYRLSSFHIAGKSVMAIGGNFEIVRTFPLIFT